MGNWRRGEAGQGRGTDGAQRLLQVSCREEIVWQVGPLETHDGHTAISRKKYNNSHPEGSEHITDSCFSKQYKW